MTETKQRGRAGVATTLERSHLPVNEDIPGRTAEGRFLPSTRLAYQLLEVAERSQLADIASVEEDRTEQHDLPEAAQRIRVIVSKALDRVLYTQARRAAAHGWTLIVIATGRGKFTDGVARALAQQLSLNPYKAPAFLSALHRDLAEVQGLELTWGHTFAFRSPGSLSRKFLSQNGLQPRDDPRASPAKHRLVAQPTCLQ